MRERENRERKMPAGNHGDEDAHEVQQLSVVLVMPRYKRYNGETSQLATGSTG